MSDLVYKPESVKFNKFVHARKKYQKILSLRGKTLTMRISTIKKKSKSDKLAEENEVYNIDGYFIAFKKRVISLLELKTKLKALNLASDQFASMGSEGLNFHFSRNPNKSLESKFFGKFRLDEILNIQATSSNIYHMTCAKNNTFTQKQQSIYRYISQNSQSNLISSYKQDLCKKRTYFLELQENLQKNPTKHLDVFNWFKVCRFWFFISIVCCKSICVSSSNEKLNESICDANEEIHKNNGLSYSEVEESNPLERKINKFDSKKHTPEIPAKELKKSIKSEYQENVKSSDIQGEILSNSKKQAKLYKNNQKTDVKKSKNNKFRVNKIQDMKKQEQPVLDAPSKLDIVSESDPLYSKKEKAELLAENDLNQFLIPLFLDNQMITTDFNIYPRFPRTHSRSKIQLSDYESLNKENITDKSAHILSKRNQNEAKTEESEIEDSEIQSLDNQSEAEAMNLKDDAFSNNIFNNSRKSDEKSDLEDGKQASGQDSTTVKIPAISVKSYQKSDSEKKNQHSCQDPPQKNNEKVLDKINQESDSEKKENTSGSDSPKRVISIVSEKLNVDKEELATNQDLRVENVDEGKEGKILELKSQKLTKIVEPSESTKKSTENEPKRSLFETNQHQEGQFVVIDKLPKSGTVSTKCLATMSVDTIPEKTKDEKTEKSQNDVVSIVKDPQELMELLRQKVTSPDHIKDSQNSSLIEDDHLSGDEKETESKNSMKEENPLIVNLCSQNTEADYAQNSKIPIAENSQEGSAFSFEDENDSFKNLNESFENNFSENNDQIIRQSNDSQKSNSKGELNEYESNQITQNENKDNSLQNIANVERQPKNDIKTNSRKKTKSTRKQKSHPKNRNQLFDKFKAKATGFGKSLSDIKNNKMDKIKNMSKKISDKKNEKMSEIMSQAQNFQQNSPMAKNFDSIQTQNKTSQNLPQNIAQNMPNMNQMAHNNSNMQNMAENIPNMQNMAQNMQNIPNMNQMTQNIPNMNQMTENIPNMNQMTQNIPNMNQNMPNMNQFSNQVSNLGNMANNLGKSNLKQPRTNACFFKNRKNRSNLISQNENQNSFLSPENFSLEKFMLKSKKKLETLVSRLKDNAQSNKDRQSLRPRKNSHFIRLPRYLTKGRLLCSSLVQETVCSRKGSGVSSRQANLKEAPKFFTSVTTQLSATPKAIVASDPSVKKIVASPDSSIKIGQNEKIVASIPLTDLSAQNIRSSTNSVTGISVKEVSTGSVSEMVERVPRSAKSSQISAIAPTITVQKQPAAPAGNIREGITANAQQLNVYFGKKPSMSSFITPQKQSTTPVVAVQKSTAPVLPISKQIFASEETVQSKPVMAVYKQEIPIFGPKSNQSEAQTAEEIEEIPMVAIPPKIYEESTSSQGKNSDKASIESEQLVCARPSQLHPETSEDEIKNINSEELPFYRIKKSLPEDSVDLETEDFQNIRALPSNAPIDCPINVKNEDLKTEKTCDLSTDEDVDVNNEDFVTIPGKNELNDENLDLSIDDVELDKHKYDDANKSDSESTDINSEQLFTLKIHETNEYDLPTNVEDESFDQIKIKSPKKAPKCDRFKVNVEKRSGCENLKVTVEDQGGCENETTCPFAKKDPKMTLYDKARRKMIEVDDSGPDMVALTQDIANLGLESEDLAPEIVTELSVPKQQVVKIESLFPEVVNVCSLKQKAKNNLRADCTCDRMNPNKGQGTIG